MIWANKVPSISPKTLVNGVDTARHGLTLRQHRATACTELLETNVGRYLYISNIFLIKSWNCWVPWSRRLKNYRIA